MATTDSILRGYLSDNAAGASPEIIEAVSAASLGLAAPYGNDERSRGVAEQFSTIFEHAVHVFPVGTGSAANAIGLAALTPPWGSILSHPDAHIANDEAGAPEFFSNGAKIVAVDGPDSKDSVAGFLAAVGQGNVPVAASRTLGEVRAGASRGCVRRRIWADRNSTGMFGGGRRYRCGSRCGVRAGPLFSACRRDAVATSFRKNFPGRIRAVDVRNRI